MGRFEDLVKAAKEGDASALDALESEFSGSTLREKAESADSLQARLDAALPLVRKAKLADLMEQLDDDLKAVGLTADDFRDVDPESLTLEMVTERAKSQAGALQASKLQIAKDAGFETVEEFDAAITAAKNQATQRVQGMESVGGGVSSSGGAPSGQGGLEEDVTRTAFEAAKKLGQADDLALAAAVGAALEAQIGAMEE